MKYKQKIFLVIILSLVVGSSWISHTDASSLSFTPVTVKVKAGQTFKLNVNADPQGVNNYTVKASIKFPPDMVSLQTWNFNDRWLPLRQPGYDDFSNVTGTLIRTAGYTDGFDNTAAFGTATFVAKKTGTATIQFSADSIILDRDNKNTYAGGNTANIVVDGAPVSTPQIVEVSTSSTSTIPDQLFDINFDIANQEVSKVSEIYPQLSFKSFGKVPTDVEMTFEILDRSGKTIIKDVASTTVETEALYTHHFKDQDIAPGNYLLRTVTVYNNGVTDEFDRIIVIVEPSVYHFSWQWIVLIILTLLLIILVALRKKYEDKNIYEYK